VGVGLSPATVVKQGAYSEDALVEQPAIALLRELGVELDITLPEEATA